MAIDKDSAIWGQIKKVMKFQKILSDIQDTTSPDLDATILEIQAVFNADRVEEIDAEGLFDFAVSLNDTLNSNKIEIKDFVDNALLSLVEQESYTAEIEGSVQDILTQVYDDMITAGHYVLENTVTVASPASAGGSNVGDGLVIVGDLDGREVALQYCKPETVTIECISDSQLGGVGGTEVFQIKGKVATEPEDNVVGGSGVGPTLQPGNVTTILTNGEFETFTVANTPDNWTLAVGAVGVEIFEGDGAGEFAFGTSALKLVGTGTDPKLTQSINTVVQKETKYLISAIIKTSAVSAGTISVKVTGTGLSYTGAEIISINSSFPATFTRYTGIFSVPNNVPSDILIEIEGAGLTGAGEVYIDDVVIAPFVEHGGVFYAMTRGVTAFVVKDIFTSVIANDRAGNINTFLGDYYTFQMPTAAAGGSTVTDTL